MKPLNTRKWIAAATACTALLGCQARVIDSGREAGGSDEIDTRLALDAKGRPLAGARIALVKAGDSTGRLVALSSTGRDGQYPSFSVPDGAYSATLRDAQDSLGKFLDTLQISGGRARVGRDTLLALGKIRGVVRLEGGETPASVIFSLYGTDIAANVRKDGSFEIDLVPGGLFTLMGTTSLDGYGTLLRRLQLRDGQDLVIPDTLTFPVTGLLAPAQIWAESDTGTGDVRVRWNAVDHPNRMGYVLEALENGAVTSSQFLKDTTWNDSLSAYWEGLPLLGPWPSRERVYRVRTRALNGAGDSRSVAKSLVAKAPDWTHRIDSVHMVMTTDSAKETSRFQWKPFQHPNVTGWRMVRLADGVEDCSGIPVGGAWSDSTCNSATLVVIDSTQPSSPQASKIYQQKQPRLTYELVAMEKSGGEKIIYSGTKQTEVTPWIEWEKAEDPGFGGWKIKYDNDERVWKASRVGGAWENVPNLPGTEHVMGWGDSLWSVGIQDSIHLVVASRTSDGVWKKRIIAMNEPIRTLVGLSVNKGELEVVTDSYFKIMFWRLQGDSLTSVSEFAPDRDYFISAGGSLPRLYPISDSFFYEGAMPSSQRHPYPQLEVAQIDEKSNVENKIWKFLSNGSQAVFQCGLDKRSFVWSRVDDNSPLTLAVFQNWIGDGYVVTPPPGLERCNELQAVEGVLYCGFLSSAGDQFWKAKLNFPKVQ